MKKINRKTGREMGHSPFNIIAILEDLFLMKELIEKLAYRRNDVGYSRELLPSGWQAIDTSSIDAYANVKFYISHEDNYISQSFITSFLFTCTKSRQGNYNLAWVNSLS